MDGGELTIEIADQTVLAFVLLFTRAAGALMALPSMLGVAVPIRLRLLLSIVVAGALLPMSKIALPPRTDALVIAPLLIREAILGTGLALAGALVIGAALMAGDVLGSTMELHLSTVLRSNIEVPNVLGDALAAIAGLMFFMAGLHRAILIALAKSLRVAPLGEMGLPGAEVLLKTSGQMFVLALQIALPVLVPLLILAVAQGVISRLAPQINILFAAPAAVALAGIVMLALDSHGLFAALLHASETLMSSALGWLDG